MPRHARQLSESGVYHVTFRGVGKMDIFLDNSDRRRFLSLLKRTKANDEYRLYAYCLMSNHVHLLLKANDHLERIIKRINGPYAQYFNKKYERVGHLFQDRFNSQIIEGEGYFLVCTRYIHRNPVTAGILSFAKDYPWSSFHLYANPAEPSSLVDRELLYSLFSPDTSDAIEALIVFTDSEKTTSDDDFKFIEPSEGKNPSHQVDEILTRFGLTPWSFKKAPREIRGKVLTTILLEVDISGRELAKILNIAREVIYKVKK